MARKKLYQSGNEKLQAHVKRSGGRRVTVVLNKKATDALDFMCAQYDMSQTQVISAALVAGLADIKRSV